MLDSSRKPNWTLHWAGFSLRATCCSSPTLTKYYILSKKKKKSSMKPVFIHCWWLLTWYFMIFSQNVDIKPSIWDGRLNEPHMVMVGGRFWRWFGKYRRKNSDCKWAVMCRKMRWYYQFHAVLMNPRSVACSSAVADTGPLQHSGLIVKK